MATIQYVEERDAGEQVARVYADIRQTFGLPFVPNLFKAMGHHPAYLEASWARVKAVMAPGTIDRKTKEIIALAVSATNGCEYCVNAHTAALKALGLGQVEITEVMAVVDLFNGFNRFIDGLLIESDLRP